MSGGSVCNEPGGISSPTCCSSDRVPASGCETCCCVAEVLDAALSASRRVGGRGDRDRPRGRSAGVVGCRDGVSCRGVGGAPKRW